MDKKNGVSVSFVDEHRLYNWTMPNPLPYQCFESKRWRDVRQDQTAGMGSQRGMH